MKSWIKRCSLVVTGLVLICVCASNKYLYSMHMEGPCFINSYIKIGGPEDLGATMDMATMPELDTNSGTNIIVLKKSINFTDQLTRENTIYCIKYNFDLGGESLKNPVKIPKGCTLKFEGGSLKNGALVGQNTVVVSDAVKIFGRNISLEGTWNAKEAYPEWFGAKGNGRRDNAKEIQQTIRLFSLTRLKPKTYVCNSSISIGTGKTLLGHQSVLKCKKEGVSQLLIIGDNTLIKGVTFVNVAKGYPKYGYDNGGANSTNVVYKEGIKGITIEDCIFKSAISGVYVHSACKDIIIKNCVFDGFKSLPNDHKQPTLQCAGGYAICLDADNSDSKDIDNIYNVSITDCTFRNVQRHCLYIQCVYSMLVRDNLFYANRNIVHPTPYDAVMMIYNSVDLQIIKNEFYDALEAMHLEKIGELPYNPNELRNITIKENKFYNCGDDVGENGIIGADFGDNITITNNHFTNVRGLLGAIIGLNHNNQVSITNNYCEISGNCPMNSNVIKFNSQSIYNVEVIGNKIDFSNTGKKYDKLIYTEFPSEGLVVKSNSVIGSSDESLIIAPNVKNKKVLDNERIEARKR